MKFKMAWDCRCDGCWMEKRQLKFGFMDSALPRNIGMMDIDAACEINGYFLFQEWKKNGTQLPKGQDIFARRLTETSAKIKLIAVKGDPETMECEELAVYSRGTRFEPEPCNFGQLYARIASWADRVGY